MTAARDRPLLFSAPMVRAILAGQKTQTRRIIQSPAKNMQRERMDVIKYRPPGDPWYKDHVWSMRGKSSVWGDYTHERFMQFCPYGQPGETLWVRETVGLLTGNGHRIVYRADADPPLTSGGPVRGMKWSPSIHMRREHSRITLKVTGLRAERLQDITEDDARNEGVEPLSGIGDVQAIAGDPRGRTHGSHPHTLAFAVLWDTINGDRAPWVSNPWVWVVGFERVQA